MARRFTGPRHPRREDGSQLDATFELTPVAVFELVYHHKTGGDRAMNADYHEGLELILSRIARIGGALLGVSVDSSAAMRVDPADRELNLPFPIELDEDTDTAHLRLEITRAQRAIARRPTAKPGGGNDQKRIRVTFTLNADISMDELPDLLAGE